MDKFAVAEVYMAGMVSRAANVTIRPPNSNS
jgi:hypothetical protein